MKLIDTLEKKLGRFAIPHLMRIVIIGYVIGEVLLIAGYGPYMPLKMDAILQGQVWRLLTWLLIPPSGSLIFFAIICYFYYMIGETLESLWGSFRFNFYFVTGVLLQLIAAVVVYFVFGASLNITTSYLNLSLFMAMAAEVPNAEMLLFFIIPVKMKWLAYIDAAIFALTIVFGFLSLTPLISARTIYTLYQLGITATPETAAVALIAMGNFLIYFFFYKRKPARMSSVQKNFRKQQNMAKQENRQARRGHVCAVCERTSETNPELEFRFCSKCTGGLEYCQDHIYTHVHVSEENRQKQA